MTTGLPSKRVPLAVPAYRVLVMAVASTLVSAACTSAGPPTDTGTTWERIQEEKLITFAFANEPPYTIAETENVSGQDPETLKAIMRTYGVETFNGVLVDFGGMIPGLLAGRFDVIAAGMSLTPERCQEIAFSNPILAVTQALGVTAGNPDDLHSYGDIAANPDVEVGMVRGASQLAPLEVAGVPEDRILQYPTSQEVIAALQTGRVDAVALVYPVLKGQLDALGDSGLEIAEPFERPLDEAGVLIQEYTAAGFRKGDTDLVEAYNAALAELISSGELETIVTSFGFPAEAVPPSDVTAEELCGG